MRFLRDCISIRIERRGFYRHEAFSTVFDEFAKQLSHFYVEFLVFFAEDHFKLFPIDKFCVTHLSNCFC